MAVLTPEQVLEDPMGSFLKVLAATLGIDVDEVNVDNGELNEYALTTGRRYPEHERAMEQTGHNIYLLHSVGGHEGGGEDVERVYSLRNQVGQDLVYMRHLGQYNSYEGTEWGKLERVYPREVLVTQYFTEK